MPQVNVKETKLKGQAIRTFQVKGSTIKGTLLAVYVNDVDKQPTYDLIHYTDSSKTVARLLGKGVTFGAALDIVRRLQPKKVNKAKGS